MTKKVAAKRPVSTAAKSRARGAAKSKLTAHDGPSLADVLAEVHAAIEAVIGSRAGNDQPLMEAGLDSLGKIYKLQTINIYLLILYSSSVSCIS